MELSYLVRPRHPVRVTQGHFQTDFKLRFYGRHTVQTHEFILCAFSAALVALITVPGEVQGALPTCNDPVNPVCVQICAAIPTIPDCVDALSPKSRLGTTSSKTPTVLCPEGHFN